MKFRVINLIPVAALLVSFVSGAITTTPVLAASFTVNSAAGLINAINTANTNNADDVITLSANIILTAVDNGLNGLPVIQTDSGHSLTIEGSGYTISRSGAAPDFRILQVGPGANVIINDLTITGGSNAPGAGINMQTGSNLVLDHVEVSGNNSSGRAGGIYNYYATLTIQNGSVIGKSGAPNTGCGGGGIFTEGVSPGAITILDASTVSYNQSPDCAGGGLFVLSNSQLIIRNGSVVSNNLGGDPADYPPFTDHAGGGGIYGSASPVITISDSTVSNNTAECINNPNCGGGGLKGGSSVTITNSTFSNNSANCNASTSCGGGGIYNFAALTISGSTFSGNTTDDNGGGLLNVATVNLTNSTFSANTAGIAGGGIDNGGTITIVNTTVSGNSAPAAGAGIYNASGNILNYSNTIIANSLSSGGDCISIGSIGTNINNLVEDGACSASLSGDPNLGILANNGGSTLTHALLSGSSAINAGDLGVCASTDQRSTARPQGAGCDIGAYELDTSFPVVVSDSLSAAYNAGAGPNSFTVTFNENVNDPTGDSNLNDVTNPDNYVLMEEGTVAGFQTTACNSINSIQDTHIVVTSVTYIPNIASVNLGSAVPNGSYRLFVCGTTSIMDTALNELNNGTSDYTFDFTVGLTASSLPDTGFAPNRISSLPAQSVQYANLGSIWLEIPSLDVKSEIVGVPQSAEGWDVTWLGNSVGWLNGTAFPSWAGNSVLTGHVWNSDNTPGLFVNLKTLKYGDQIKVGIFGQVYTYEVRENRTVWPNQVDVVMEHETYATLTLLTCEDYQLLWGSYSMRRVVKAVLINVH